MHGHNTAFTYHKYCSYYVNLCKSMPIHTHIATINYTYHYTVIRPDDVTVCEGRSTTFTCVLNGSINSDDVQWYRLIKDTGTTEMVHQQGSNIRFTTSTTNNILNSSLIISNARKSHIGYYWVRLPSDDVCNVSLTVIASMCNIIHCMQ